MNPMYRPYGRGALRGVESTTTPAAQPVQQQQLTEEESWVTLDVQLAAGGAVRDLGKDIDKDGNFVLTHIWGVSTGAYTIQLRLFTGRPLSSSPVNNTNFVGTVAFKTPVKPMFFPAGSRISVDLVNTSGAPNTIQIVFGGIRQLIPR